MNFKIFDNQKIIYGITDSSLGPINPFANFDSEKRLIKFINNKKITEKKLIFADQIHGNGIHICQKGDSGSIRLNIDGMMSNLPYQVLVIKTADCVPILMYESNKKVIAAIHCGRKSLTKGIIPKTVDTMTKNYRISPKNVLVAIGPHIRKEHYYLKDVALKSLKNTKWQKYFVKNSKVCFDLTAAVLDELKLCNIDKENIEDCDICTYCDWKEYYSARKREENPAIYDNNFSCFASFIALEE